jgi:hypothetical protein
MDHAACICRIILTSRMNKERNQRQNTNDKEGIKKLRSLILTTDVNDYDSGQ